MQPILFVLIFISFWLGIVGLACIGILIGVVFRFQQIMQEGFSPMLLIPFAMFLFGCFLTTFASKGESKISKDFLAKLLEAQESTK